VRTESAKALSYGKEKRSVRKLISIIFWIVVGMALMYGMQRHHIVRTEERWLLVPKDQIGLRDTYVDMRGWTSNDLQEHPQVVKALVENGHRDVVAAVVAEDARGGVETIIDTVLGK
jgi:hypothetical protein